MATPTPQELLRQQLAMHGTSAHASLTRPRKGKGKANSSAALTSRPRNDWQKRKRGDPLTRVEEIRKVEAARKKKALDETLKYVQGAQNGKAAKAQENLNLWMKKAMAERKRLTEARKATRKPAVKVGERQLGPGFLERYKNSNV